MRHFRQTLNSAVIGWATIAAAANPGLAANSEQAGADPAAASAAPSGPAVDPAKVAELIAQLDDDRFAVREAAQQELTAAGPAALADVGQAAAAGSLERSTRAVNILLGWSQASESGLNLGALEQLAALKNRPTEAAVAAQRLADVREAAALKAIVDLGGRVDFDRQFTTFNGPTPPLQVVIGPKWKGGIEGLKHVQAVRRASTLSFHSAEIGEEAVDHLSPFTQLQRVEFYGVKLSPEAIAKLRADLPKVTVEVRSGARLGIAGPHPMVGLPNPGGALVTQVFADSAAAKAGLLQGDVITHLTGGEVKDFEQLTKEIAKCQPGDSVALKVIRQGPPGQPPQVKDITVTFDRWGDEAPLADPAVGMPGVPDPLGMVPRGLGQPLGLDNRR